MLLEENPTLEQPRLSRVAAGSIVTHCVLIAILLLAPFPASAPFEAPAIVADLRKATPLVAPPTTFTQPEPTRGKVSQELNVEGLMPRPQVRQSPPPGPVPKIFSPPKAAEAGRPAPTMPEPPPLPTQVAAAPSPVPGMAPIPGPPQIQPEEKPKLAFEKVTGFTPPANPKLTPRMVLPQGAGGGGIVVGDSDEITGSTGGTLSQSPSPSQSASQLQLLSDPTGVDFRPYLARVLAAVRRNWFAVLPESVRMGRRGRVQIMFAINRDGSVPKLVIASPSGAEALDRAAVAGISASNPFPPLPPEFKGEQVRLQLTFTYNMAGGMSAR